MHHNIIRPSRMTQSSTFDITMVCIQISHTTIDSSTPTLSQRTRARQDGAVHCGKLTSVDKGKHETSGLEEGRHLT
jgi:hypothetical protein